MLWGLLKNTSEADTQTLRRLIYKYNRALEQDTDDLRPDILQDIQRAAEEHLSRIHADYTPSPRFRDAIAKQAAPYQTQLSQLAAFVEGRMEPDKLITVLQTPAMQELLALFKPGFHETYGKAILVALYGNVPGSESTSEKAPDLSLGVLVNIEGHINELLRTVAYPFKPTHKTPCTKRVATCAALWI